LELDQLLRKRRNVYGFLPRRIPEPVLERIMENAIHVPSAGFSQDFDLVVVKDAATKRKLADSASQRLYEKKGLAMEDFVAGADVVVVPCGNKARFEAVYGKPAEANSRIPWWVVDSAFSALVVVLSAFDQGVAASFIGAFDDKKVASILKLPKDGSVVPLALVLLGYPDPAERRLWKIRRARGKRKSVGSMVHRSSRW
jgi:nitroreductase